MILNNLLPLKNISLKWFVSFPTQHKIIGKKIRAKSNTDPDFFYNLTSLSLTGNQAIFKDKLDLCIAYYAEIKNEYRWLVSAGTFQGLCEYYHGDKIDAANNFEKIIALLPNSFWLYYNLGIINTENGHQDKAENYFSKALSVPVNKILPQMLASPLYRKLLESHGISDNAEEKRIEEIRQRCVLAIKLIHTYSKNLDQGIFNKNGIFVTII